VRTLGGEDDDLFLHNPTAVCFAADGTAYVLNAGECQVLHLDADWRLLDSFGRCGQGPGEFENPVGMVLYRDQLWVFEMARISVFDLAGNALRTLQPGTQYALPAVVDGRLMAVMGTGRRAAAWLDDDGRVAQSLGPECPEDFFEAFKACRNMVILPHADGACLLMNAVDGNAYLVDADGEPVWTRQVIEHDDDARYSEQEEDGEKTMSMSLSLGMGRGCRDGRGRYWTVVYGEDEDAPALLQIHDKDMRPLETQIALPDGVLAWELLFSPRGRLVMIVPQESVIHVCDVSTTD